MDTSSIVSLLVNRLKKIVNNKDEYQDHITERKDEIWKLFFKTELPVFKSVTGYKFRHMVSTDGVGCSILFQRNDLEGKYQRKKKVALYQEFNYIDDSRLDISSSKKIVAIDPGKEDLIYCVDSAAADAKVFKHSQNQRRKELKMKKYRTIRLNERSKWVEGRRVVEWESESSAHSHKTLNFERFQAYIQEKCALMGRLAACYNKKMFRKLRFGALLNAKRSEGRMMKNFRKIFGPPEDVVIAIGDWCQKRHLPFKEPTLGTFTIHL